MRPYCVLRVSAGMRCARAMRNWFSCTCTACASWRTCARPSALVSEAIAARAAATKLESSSAAACIVESANALTRVSG